MIRNFFRHLANSFKNLFRNGWMTIAAISMVTVTLTLVGIFAAGLLNIERIASGVENNIQINVYLDPSSQDNSETTTDPAGQTIANTSYHSIYNQIQALDGVDSITFSSKDDQLAQLQETMGEDWKLFDGDSNPLSDAYIVKTKTPDDVKSVAEAIQSIQGVDSVEYGGTSSENIMALASKIRLWGLVGTGILVLVAIFLISNTIRMTIFSRSRDIEIMRLVGAKNSYIRGPFFYEGAWVGLIGAIVPAVIIYFGYHWVYDNYNPSLLTEGLSLYDINVFLPAMIGAMALVGIVIGSLGSILSMRRFLKI
ncbi:permease-like cell division protein FtsX [Streptococcus loxodontisalivarius]|uniref:Cell division protein FtsX n=1 Tax=Streptococcus loxodontisalivarius TaxID=1349415 RepID=A0ABS2PRA2_9STRE|nr:permease-like cell division protein FtsX [Streptococcus loxodontisalivarius]MBM7642569.1 cell division transport system permease protein [Streptococcus loxodontisalivarius]